MNRKVLRIIIGLVFIGIGTIYLIKTFDFYWVALIIVGIMYIYKALNNKKY